MSVDQESQSSTSFPFQIRPSTSLSTSQVESLDQILDYQLEKTIEAYETYTKNARNLDPHHWRPLQSKGKLTVYKDIRTTTGNTENGGGELDENFPTLLTVGSMDSSVEDAMLGLLAPDTPEMHVTGHYLDSGMSDGIVLMPLRLPTTEEPFTFRAVKWFVQQPPKRLKRLATARELVYVEGMGMASLSDGTQVGYVLRRPVDVPQLPQSSTRTMRTRLTECCIFAPGKLAKTVDVYCKGKVAPSGAAPASLMISWCADTFLATVQAPISAQKKKLSWIAGLTAGVPSDRMSEAASESLADEDGSKRSHTTFDNLTAKAKGMNHAKLNPIRAWKPHDGASPLRCTRCDRKFGAFHSAMECNSCRESVCSKCRIAFEISIANRTDSMAVEYARVLKRNFCTKCNFQAHQLNSFSLATTLAGANTYGVLPSHHHVSTKSSGHAVSSTDGTGASAEKIENGMSILLPQDQDTTRVSSDQRKSSSPSPNKRPMRYSQPSYDPTRDSIPPMERVSSSYDNHTSDGHVKRLSISMVDAKEMNKWHLDEPTGMKADMTKTRIADQMLSITASTSTMFSSPGDSELENEWRESYTPHLTTVDTTPTSATQAYQNDLYDRMNRLRMAADDAYKMAKQTTSVHMTMTEKESLSIEDLD